MPVGRTEIPAGRFRVSADSVLLVRVLCPLATTATSAAFEQPALFVDELRAYVYLVR